MSISPTMRTILQPTADSGTDDLTLTIFPTPTPNLSENEHLIRVHTCSPCAGELLWYKNFPPPVSRVLIPCPDVAGTVVTAPANSPFPAGTEVYARTNYLRPANARDYTIGVTGELALKPQRLSWAEAAAVPVSAQTAWQALFVHAGIAPRGADGKEADWAAAEKAWAGKKVFVTAAAGGVGIWVVQLAALLGAEVIGTCGGAKHVELVKSLGAKEALDYRVTDLRKWAEEHEEWRVDVVVDCIGQKAVEDAWWFVKDEGTVLSIFRPPAPSRPEGVKAQGVKDVFFIMGPRGDQLQEITRLIDEGKCRPTVDSVWPLEKFREAFRRVDTGHAQGKVILDLLVGQ
ncbi:hypothetical protein FE257_011998 [Aspergillus nanangensis]|uniref:Enoyl reductase (ER) domain-containing protein n=1 Tax=Aspergillus nanangensis TaxID=2582783 RepID=A0AAD4CI11_ASPNN|nr:hypothetical protein FE257_011998 [Aspergillus nanangensis]